MVVECIRGVKSEGRQVWSRKKTAETNDRLEFLCGSAQHRSCQKKTRRGKRCVKVWEEKAWVRWGGEEAKSWRNFRNIITVVERYLVKGQMKSANTSSRVAR